MMRNFQINHLVVEGFIGYLVFSSASFVPYRFAYGEKSHKPSVLKVWVERFILLP